MHVLSSPGWLTAITGLIIAVGTGVAWLIRRHDAKKDPLPREQAEVAVAAANVGLLSEVNLRLSEDSRRQAVELAQVRSELVEVRSRAINNDRQIAELQESHGQMKALFGSATGFIEELLQWVHDGMPASSFPVLPANLRAFVARALHDPPGAHRREADRL